MKRSRWRRARLLPALLLLLAAAAGAELPLEQPGRVERLPEPPRPHWLWATDVLLEKAALVDLDDGRLLGIVSGGYGPWEAVFSARRGELYVPEIYYARKTRGERSDVLSIYDVQSLAPIAEVPLPPKRALSALPYGNVAISDDERFVAVFNMTPATSLSIVDVEARRFVGEIPTPGCSLVYAAGPRRFVLLCMSGALMVVTLDAEGHEASKVLSTPFFDPTRDPITEKAARFGQKWLFASFEGRVHTVDVSADEIRFEEPWPLADQPPGADGWRIGGTQHLAVHERSGRLYALMHQGGPDTHKEPGTEVWVYDLASRERLQRIRLVSPGLTFLGQSLAFGGDWIWPFKHLYRGLLALLPEPRVASIQVTQDERPLLATSSLMVGSMAIYDALSGVFQRRVVSGNLTVHALQAPFGRPGWSR